MSETSVLRGVGAAMVMVLAWAAWIVGTRYAVITTLDPAALSIVRYAVPTLFLAPVLFKSGILPECGLPRWLVPITFMVGLPFFFLVAYGVTFAPASEAAPLLPGTIPFFVAILSAIFLRERFGKLRLIGFALILFGIIVMVGDGLLYNEGDAWIGRIMVMGGSFSWAIYTLLYRKSGLGALEGTALFAFWSFIAVLPFGTVAFVEAVQDGHIGDLLIQGLIQGVGSGVIAVYCFGVAVRHLGTSAAAAFAALIPAVAAMFAVPLLGETLGLVTITGIIATSLGVAFASGVFRRGS